MSEKIGDNKPESFLPSKASQIFQYFEKQYICSQKATIKFDKIIIGWKAIFDLKTILVHCHFWPRSHFKFDKIVFGKIVISGLKAISGRKAIAHGCILNNFIL